MALGDAAPEHSVEAAEVSKILQEEALSRYYHKQHGVKETPAHIGRVAAEAPKLGAWSQLFSCSERRRGRRPLRYSVQVAKGHPSGCRSVTPSQTTPSAPSGGRPFVGPPLTLPPAVLEAAVQASLEAREGWRLPDRAPSAPPPGCGSSMSQRFPCLKVSGVPCDSPPPVPAEPASTMPASRGSASPSKARAWEQPLPFKAGSPRPRLIERSYAPVPFAGTAALAQGGGGEQGTHVRDALAATAPVGSALGAEKFDMGGGKTGGSPPGTGLRESSFTVQALGSQTEEMPGSTRSSARRWSQGVMSSPRSELTVTPGVTPSGVRRASISSPPGGLSAVASSPSGARRLRFHGSMLGEGCAVDERTPSPCTTPTLPLDRKGGGKNGPIWKLSHRDSKGQRLERLNSSRKSKLLQESPDCLRDRVTRRWEVDLALDSFLRYFPQKTGNDTDLVGLREALADFGLRARIRTEKLLMQKLLLQFEESPTLSFSDFCSAVEEVRAKLRSTHTSAVFRAWKHADRADVGAVGAEELVELLTALGFQPQTSQDKLMFDNMLDELESDANGLYPFQEAEFLVSWFREHAESTRRHLERSLKEAYSVDDTLFNALRTQILEMHKSFLQADEDGDSLLDREEALSLLADYGLMSSERHRRVASELIDRLGALLHLGGLLNSSPRSSGGDSFGTPAKSQEEEKEAKADSLDFPFLLALLLNVRNMEVEEKKDGVQALFSTYDIDNCGKLSIKDICRLLVDLRLQPRTPVEQESIARLLEEMDEDGSGQLDVEQLTRLAQRIGEKALQLQRKAENARAESLGFSRRATGQLRRVFEALDTNHCGCLTMQQVEMAVHLMGWRIQPSRLQKMVTDCDFDKSGGLEFSEFLRMMRHLEDEMKPPGSTSSAAAIDETAAAHVAHGSPLGAHGSPGAAAAHGGMHAALGAAISVHGAAPPTPAAAAGSSAWDQQETPSGGQGLQRGSQAIERATSNFGFQRRGALRHGSMSVRKVNSNRTVDPGSQHLEAALAALPAAS